MLRQGLLREVGMEIERTPTVAIGRFGVCRSGSERSNIRRSNEQVFLQRSPGISEVFNIFESDTRRIPFSTRRSHNGLVALGSLCRKNNSSTLYKMTFQPGIACV